MTMPSAVPPPGARDPAPASRPTANARDAAPGRDAGTAAEPVRLVNGCIVALGLGIAAFGLTELDRAPSWIWAAFGAGGLIALIGGLGFRYGRWLQPMFGALYAFAVALIVVGPLTDLDIYPAAGVICLTVLSVGAAILHRLGPPPGR